MATDKVKYWIEIANYDIGTSEALFKTRRWLYVAFMCHQAIEKTLKAYWCATREDDRLIRTTTNVWPRVANYTKR